MPRPCVFIAQGLKETAKETAKETDIFPEGLHSCHRRYGDL